MLDRRKRGQAQSPTGPVSLGKLPRLQVARADVPDLPGVNQVIKCAECLRKGHVRVECMRLIKVNVVGLEASQARLARPDNVISPETGIVWPGSSAVEHFRGDHQTVPPTTRGKPPPENRFAQASKLGGRKCGVDISTVKERDAFFDRGVEDLERGGFVSLVAERQGSETHFRDMQARLSQPFGAHVSNTSLARKWVRQDCRPLGGDSDAMWEGGCSSGVPFAVSQRTVTAGRRSDLLSTARQTVRGHHGRSACRLPGSRRDARFRQADHRSDPGVG